jgi:hypothetical protein
MKWTVGVLERGTAEEVIAATVGFWETFTYDDMHDLEAYVVERFKISKAKAKRLVRAELSRQTAEADAKLWRDDEMEDLIADASLLGETNPTHH